MGAGVATELEQLKDALMRAIDSSPATAQRVATVLRASGVPGMADAWVVYDPGPNAAQERLLLLKVLRRDHPQVFSGLRAIAAEFAVLPEAASTVINDITQVPLVRTAGDHVDFRDGRFHDRVVGVQHNHYGTVPAPAQWRPVEHVGPVEFGVRPTRHVPGLPDVPPYVPRDCDDDLHAKLVHNGLVLILGEPYAGKSYTAWQGVRSLEGHRLCAPDSGEDLRALLSALHGKPGEYVVWLDELTDHLGVGGLDPRLLGRLTSLGVVVLGSMSPDEYYRRRTGTAPGDRVVAAARTVRLEREWSKAELERLAALDDPRAYPAYMWSGREGAASYFAIGHHLFDEWRRVGTQLEHPRGQLLVRAAVDLARCGVTAAVPVDLLRAVQEQYGTVERESFEDAIDWATTPMFGVSGLLVEGDENNTWRAYGALVAEALGPGDLEPVPDEVWWTLLDAAREPGSPLDFRAVVDAARTAMYPRLQAGDPTVALGFARRVEGDEREAWLRRAADAGHPQAALELAEFLRDRGDEGGALPYLEQAAEAGNSRAAAVLGSLLRKRAEHWLRVAAEAGDGAAAHQLGDMLVGTGREDEALSCYYKAAFAGRREVAASLGTLLSSWRDPEAEIWLRYGAAWGDARAAGELGLYLSRQDEQGEAEMDRFFQQAAEGGDANGARNLGLSREKQGRFDEAMALYRQALEGGIMDTETSIGLLLQKQGKPEEAEEWLRKAAATNPTGLPETLPPPPPRHTPTESPDTVKE